MEVRAYGAHALEHIERLALYADRVDWPAARGAVAAAAARGTTAADLHDELRAVLHEACGPHGGLSTATGRAPADRRPLPSARLVGDVGVLVLPACPGDRGSVRGYTVAGGRALRRLGPAARWSVDLRGNGGGSMWPMLAVAAPLLRGDGVLGAFVDRDGTRTPWWLRRRRIGIGHRASARSRGPLRLPGPVAVLTDGRTASAAESVAVAFRGLPDVRSYGAPTAGLSTSNTTVRLPDGALLHITSARLADRTGAVHEGPLRPDVPAGNALAAALADLR